MAKNRFEAQLEAYSGKACTLALWSGDEIEGMLQVEAGQDYVTLVGEDGGESVLRKAFIGGVLPPEAKPDGQKA